MHPCLEIAELLHLILNQIYDNLSSRQNQQGLLSVGLTCHLFLETALDLMWHTQSSFVPLIKTLPQELWRDTPKTGFDRTFQLTVTDSLTEADLTRFRFYARRIRTLNYVPYAWHTLGPKITPETVVIYKTEDVDEEDEETTEPDPNKPPVIPKSPLTSLTNVPHFHVADLNILFYIWQSQRDNPGYLDWQNGINIPPPLLPNLKSLHIIQNEHYVTCPPLFLSPSIRQITFENIADNEISLQPIAKHVPALQVLDVGPLVQDAHSSRPEGEVWDGLLEPLKGMEYLKEVRCEMWKVKKHVVKSFVALQDLQVLKIANDVEDLLLAIKGQSMQSEGRPSQPLAALKHLHFEVKSNLEHIEMCLEFLGSIRSVRLESIFIGFEGGTPATAQLNELVAELGGLNSETLKSVTLTLAKDKAPVMGRHRLGNDPPISPPTNPSTLLNVSLKNLYALREIETFAVTLPCLIDMNDGDMKDLSEAWPNLKHLQLGPKEGTFDVPDISLLGLELLVKNCLKLATLGLTFDAQVPTRSQSIIDHDINLTPNMRVQHLGVGSSTVPVLHVQEVGRFLARLFPKLNLFEGKWLFETARAQLRHNEDSFWQQVLEIVKDEWAQRNR